MIKWEEQKLGNGGWELMEVKIGERDGLREEYGGEDWREGWLKGRIQR